MVSGLRRLVVGHPAQVTRPSVAPLDSTRRVVLGGWILLSFSLLLYVIVYAPNRPTSDEWDYLAELTGEKPIGPWLFAPHNEHRYPLSRLIWIALYRLSGGDFRLGTLLSVFLMAWASLALMGIARQFRGRSHVADLLIPALMLNFGHWENYLMGYQLGFTIPVAVSGLALAAMLNQEQSTNRRLLLGVGLASIIIVLNGGAGIILGTPLAAWVVFAAVRSRCWTGLLMPVVAMGYSAIVLLFLRTGTGLVPNTWSDRFTTAFEMLAGGLGGLARPGWPVSGIVVGLPVLVSVLGLLGIVMRRSGTDRQTAMKLLVILTGFLGLVAAIALSRTGQMPGVGFAIRYAIFSAFSLVAAYLAGVRFLRFPDSRYAVAVSAILTLVVFSGSIYEGIWVGKTYAFIDARTKIHARAGAPPEQLAEDENIGLRLNGTQNDRFINGLKILARHRIGPYRR